MKEHDLSVLEQVRARRAIALLICVAQGRGDLGFAVKEVARQMASTCSDPIPVFSGGASCPWRTRPSRLRGMGVPCLLSRRLMRGRKAIKVSGNKSCRTRNDGISINIVFIVKGRHCPRRRLPCNGRPCHHDGAKSQYFGRTGRWGCGTLSDNRV